MKFTVSPITLKTAFFAVKSVISTKSLMPVMVNVLFRPAEDGKSFSLVASDGDMSIEYPLSIEEGENLSSFLVPSYMLDEYIRSINSDFPLVFEVTGREVCISDIFCDGYEGATRFSSNADASEYPIQRPLNEGFKCFTLPAENWCDALSSARSYCSNDELRVVMTGVYADFQSDRVTVAASDSKKLFREHVAISSTGLGKDEHYGVILPRKLVALLSGVIDRSADITFSCDNKVICIQQDGIVIYARCIEGRYPRYDAVIPRANNRVAIINRQQLLSAIKRVMIASNRSVPCVAFDFDGHSAVKLEAQNVDESTYSSLRIPTNEQTDSIIRIGMNGKFFQEVLDSFKRSDNIRISMLDPTRAITITSPDNDARLCLLMPINLASF